MLILAFLSLIFANLVNHSKGIKQDVKTTLLFIVYVWLILIFSHRGTSVPDTEAYMSVFNSTDKSGGMEILFTWMSQFLNSIGLSFNGFLFVYQLILFSLWFYTSSKHFEDIHLPFLVFFPFMGIYNFGIIIRAGMGLCLCYFAITYLLYHKNLKGYLIYFAIVTLSILFHKAMIVFYILPLFMFKNFNTVVLLVLLIFAILIPLFNIQRLVADAFEAYIKFFSSEKLLTYTQFHAKFDAHAVYSKTMIKYWLLALLFLSLRSRVITKREIYNSFLNIYIFGVLLITLTHFIDAGNRLAYMFFFFEFALVGLIFENSRIPKKIVILGAIALIVLNYLNLISAVPEMLTY